MKKYTADKIFTLTGQPLNNHVVVTDNDGVIMSIDAMSDHDSSSVQSFKGIITPGFVNTHCHLELSHMKGLVNSGTGLIPFISSVVKHRDFPEEQIMDAIAAADQEMYDEGIVAVGDISNKIDTVATKTTSKINYYTFVEMFDFMQSEMTDDTIDQYKSVFECHSDADGNKKSFVPHAPYSVSEGLYEFIRNENFQHDTVSIHNQETEAEQELFKTKTGAFLRFYDGFEFKLDKLRPTGKGSIYHAMQNMNAMMKTLFVHNTMTSKDDITAALDWNFRCYWATCANANLYIENRLPDYQAFLEADAKMTIGTDSLTSNWQLSVLEEMKTIKKYKSYVPVETLITWACKNGAEALGYSDELGTIEVGKKPGLVHVDAVVGVDGSVDISESSARRI
ncbi:MAG: cytosine/adenosine deaminase-related metal-dependent hydrolase [Saprospiraceae bacterium]|jgi:cytosine/adenosine deaminase-related metal-dependent hydrolase